MRDILEGLYNTDTEEGKKKSQWCSFLFYLCLLASFVISCVASYRASKGYINKTLFTYQFRVNNKDINFPAGTPVSLDWNGEVQRGGGFGIYRDIYTSSNPHEMKNLRTEVVGGHIIVNAYNGWLMAMYVDGEDVSEPTYLETSSKGITVVDHLIKLNETKLVLVGSNRLLPVEAADSFDGKKHTIKLTLGQPKTITDMPKGQFPHVDDLQDGKSVAYIFEDLENYRLMAGYAVWRGQGESAYMDIKPAEVANEDCVYSYHGIAGMRGDTFLIAATGKANNGTISPEPFAPIRVKVAHITEDGKMTFGDWKMRIFSDNVNWFAMDNFNGYMAVISYYDETEGNGVVAMAILMDGPDSVRFGGYTLIESGGAMKPETVSHISMRILSDSRFGVLFPDASNNGNLIFMMAERTDNNDISRVGANFIIARSGGRRQSKVSFNFAVGRIDWSRFILMDSYVRDNINYVGVNVGYHLAYPVGITTSRGKTSKYIQFHGVYKYTDGTKLVPGYTYYTNSKGALVRGRAYGWNHAEFGSYYVVSNVTYEICALHNQIGIAVSEKELLIRTY